MFSIKFFRDFTNASYCTDKVEYVYNIDNDDNDNVDNGVLNYYNRREVDENKLTRDIALFRDILLKANIREINMIESIIDFNDYSKIKDDRNYNRIFVTRVVYLNEHYYNNEYSDLSDAIKNGIISNAIKSYLYCTGPLGVYYFDEELDENTAGIIIGWVHNDGVLYYRVRIPSDENIRLVRSNIDGQGSLGIDIAYFADDDDEQNYYGPYYLEIEIKTYYIS